MSDVEMENVADEGEEKPSSSDDSSDSSDNEDEDLEEAKLIQDYIAVLAKINENKYNYDDYVHLLEIAHKMTDLDKIRQSCELFSSVYPLSPDIWLKWLKIEVTVASTEHQINAVSDLFKRALSDYFSIDVAFEYMNLALKSSKEKAEEIWEILVPTYALHCMKGRSMFEVYRNDFLSKNEDNLERLEMLVKLYEKELKIPLFNMQESYIEFKVLCTKNKDKICVDMGKFERRYINTKEVLQKMIPFEERLMVLDSKSHQKRAEMYKEYIANVRSDLDDDELQILYERMVAECCLNYTVWMEYLKYLERYPPRNPDSKSLVFKQTALDVVNRALKNCTWSAELYVEKMRILERFKHSKDEVLKIIEVIATVGFLTPEPAVKIWLEYLSYLWRQTNFEEEKERDILRANFDLAWNTLGRTWGALADTTCEMLQFWGRLEYGPLNDYIKGRDLWNTVMGSADNSTKAGLWIEFAHLEMKRGAEAARKLFRRALHADQLNDLDTIIGAWTRFERCNGNLEQLESCQEICGIRLANYYDAMNYQNPKLKAQNPIKKNLKRQHIETEVFKKPAIPPAKNVEEKIKRIKLEDTPEKPPEKEIDKTKDNIRVFISNLGFEVTESEVIDTFPELKIKNFELVIGTSGKSRGFGYAELETEDDVKLALSFDRRPLHGRPVFISNCARDKSERGKFKYAETFEPNKLFIKGLPFEAGKEDLEMLFKPFGNIRDIRIVCFRSGKSKGIAYVEFEKEASAKNALLKLDQHVMDGFTISVALSAPPPKNNAPSAEFKPSLGGGKRLVAKGDVKQKMSSLIPTVVKKNALAGIISAGKPPTDESKPKSNEDFRKMFFK